jgi:hypothetical protein
VVICHLRGPLALLERGEIFLQPVDMLLHLDDGRPEFLRRAQGPTQVGSCACAGR